MFRNSLQIARPFGIPIRLHWTFILLVGVWVMSSGLVGTIVLLPPLFLVVVLHELGHSLVARRFGVRVLDIVLWPLGGMARLANMPEDSKVEGLVAIAGPAVNFVLLALALPPLVLSWSALGPPEGFFLSATAGPPAPLTTLLWVFVAVNFMLGTFNLLPAFPMDGGRVLRAWFARSTDWVTATERAVRVGRAVTVALLVLLLPISVFVAPGMFCSFPIIALFIWFAGGQELLAVRLKHGRVFGGGPAAGPRPTEAAFGPAPGPPRPAASGDARRPTAPGGPPGGQRGFDDDFVRELERRRGRLLRPDDDA